MDVSVGLVLLIFGYAVFSLAVIGLVAWGLIAMLPPLREEHPQLYGGLARLSGQWLTLGVVSFAIGLLL
ncbi:MAG: hypothetical protein ACK46X_12810, partial [Candidatus Sericytochromatia bacterium]